MTFIIGRWGFSFDSYCKTDVTETATTCIATSLKVENEHHALLLPIIESADCGHYILPLFVRTCAIKK